MATENGDTDTPAGPGANAAGTAADPSGPEPWRTVRTHGERDHRIFTLREHVMVSPRTGSEHPIVVLDTPDWVSVIAFDVAGELVMVRQYRHGIDEVTLEVPGGMVEPGSTPEETALEELRQETGCDGAELVKIGEVAPVPAFLTNRLHVFVAQGVVCGGEPDLDEGEDIHVVLIPYAEVRRMVGSGELVNAQVVAALFLYELWREGQA